MMDLAVELFQVEGSDFSDIRNILTKGFKSYLNENINQNGLTLSDWFDKVRASGTSFSIKVSKSDGDFVGRNWLVGLCGLTEIDFISKHAKFFFFMVDKDGHKSYMQDYPATNRALKLFFDFCFNEMNLNKVWIGVLDNNSKSIFEKFKFQADGVRIDEVFLNGEYRDEYVFSLSGADYQSVIV